MQQATATRASFDQTIEIFALRTAPAVFSRDNSGARQQPLIAGEHLEKLFIAIFGIQRGTGKRANQCAGHPVFIQNSIQ
jgi:hypothetical protein